MCIWYNMGLEEKVGDRRMRALQSDLARRMMKAGINLTKHRSTGEPIVFEGKTYIIKTVPRADK